MNKLLHFDTPNILLLLWITPFILWLWLWLRKRAEDKLQRFISNGMQTKLRFPISRSKMIMQAVLISLGIILLIISVAGPFSKEKKISIPAYSHDIVIALDVSASMLAQDIHPSRLSFAKSTITEVALKLPKDRLALLTFRHGTRTVCPLTYDRQFLQQTIKLISIHSAPAGETDIGNAITTATRLLNNNSDAHKIIILLSDGEDLTDRIEDAITIANKNNITIITVGIGTQKGTTIPDPMQPDKPYIYNKKTVITRLNSLTLKALAESTNGKYIPIYKTGRISPADICTEFIKKITRKEIANKLKKSRIYNYNIFLLPAFLLFLIALLLGLQKNNQPKRRINKTYLILLISFLTLSNSYSQELSKDEQLFNSAAEHFITTNYTQTISILDKIKTVSPKLLMAYGCTYVKQAEQLGDRQNQLSDKILLYKKATESFRNILQQEKNNPIASHNLAVSYKAMKSATIKLKKKYPLTKKQENKRKQHKIETNTFPDNSQTNKKTTINKNIRQPIKLSKKEIENILSTALSREKEYQIKKEKYGKLTPLRTDIRDW